MKLTANPIHTVSKTSSSKDIGLVAGWGQFPVRIATTLRDQGFRVHCVAIRDHADPVLRDICFQHREFGIGRMGAQVRWLKKSGVGYATMAGKIHKKILFQRKRDLIRHVPDLTCVKHFYPIYISKSKDRRDDTLLNTVVELYQSGGIEFAPATDFAPELLVKEQLLTKKAPSHSEMKDIAFGWEMAKEMGRLDIGQTVVIKNQAVMAVEAIEGTDACIERAGELCKGGFTVVKVAKPEQDMRFDVPTIGVGTIETIHRAGGNVLAIEAGQTIVLDEASVASTANRLGVSVIALDFESQFGKLSRTVGQSA